MQLGNWHLSLHSPQCRISASEIPDMGKSTEIWTLPMKVQNVTFIQKVVIALHKYLLFNKCSFTKHSARVRTSPALVSTVKYDFYFGKKCGYSPQGREQACVFLLGLLCSAHTVCAHCLRPLLQRRTKMCLEPRTRIILFTCSYMLDSEKQLVASIISPRYFHAISYSVSYGSYV